MTDDQPLVRVERGNPTPEELAALVAVVAARRAASGGEDAQAPTKANRWAAYWRTQDRAAQRPGPGAWRSRGTGR